MMWKINSISKILTEKKIKKIKFVVGRCNTNHAQIQNDTLVIFVSSRKQALELVRELKTRKNEVEKIEIESIRQYITKKGEKGNGTGKGKSKHKRSNDVGEK